MKKEKGLIKNGAVQLDDEQMNEVSGGWSPSIQTGGEEVSDGNCGNPVRIIDGKCHLHPDGINIPNCNTTCPYYCKT